ncbi:MAG: metal ABC transporter substrate-binding protein [Acidobacteria bacterium]|nr:metal ABC transporter substrate-binding protein [Acidobacteriota bacterium]MCA1652006.1 metal ABC transporter substrate-binding protein [Acidobacteriota bacterium]
MRKVPYIAAFLAAVLCGATADARAVTKVVTTTQDLESLVKEVGGDKVQVDSLAKGYQDPHFVEPKPSFILKLHGADLLVVVGRELEVGWLPPLITQARNPRIQPNADRYLDASLTAHILEIPTGQITRAMGDVHPQGNPHYWLSPENGRRIAQAIQKKLAEINPADAGYFAQRYADFDRRLAEGEKRWSAAMAPYKGTKVVTYHRSWPNFTEQFGLDVVGYVEPKPGIPPSPSHTVELIREMKRQQIKLIIMEPYFDSKTPNSIGRETGARVVVLAPSVGGAREVTDYLTLFDYNVNKVVSAINETGAK